MEPVKIGIVGCGQISEGYLRHLTGVLSGVVTVAACSDLIAERAQQRATEFKIPIVCTTAELLANPELELVVNLTMPAQHHEVTMAAFAAGKHVFCEKPLSVNRELGKEMLDTASAHGVTLAGAPDTFLGAGLQVCRRLIDEGAIGTPISGQAMYASGHASERYYNIFTGPLFDMGPYYLTALVSLLGPVQRVTGSAQIPFPEKTNAEGWGEAGKVFKVTRPGNISGVLDFASGCIGAFTSTCEAFGYQPRLEIYGTEGTITANDPNCYFGPVTLRREKGEPESVPVPEDFGPWGRGLGVAEQAQAIRQKRAPRASGALMYHILDIAHGVDAASRGNHHVTLTSRIMRPEPFTLKELVG